MLNRSARLQRGFTLIELLAVMAIIAVLAAIVAPAVSGTKNTSNEAQAAQDGIQVRNAAVDFFSDQNNTEVLTSATITSPIAVKVGQNTGDTYATLGTGTAATSTLSVTPKISSRWPEKHITNSATTSAIYFVEFPTSSTSSSASVLDSVFVLDTDSKVIGITDLFTNYTAVDTTKLTDGDYMEEAPSSASSTVSLTANSTNINVHRFLWLFKKSKSSGSATNDNREVAIFTLDSAETVSGGKYSLKYKQIF